MISARIDMLDRIEPQFLAEPGMLNLKNGASGLSTCRHTLKAEGIRGPF